jgi:SAM-dependent methyltransferase
MSELEITGERLVPGAFGKIAVEHLHRYAICLDFVKGKKVLDIASGEGYGSNLIAKYAQEVVGVDISKDAVVHAQKKYACENLEFQVGSVLDIPYESDVFDVVVSFETIEHISDHRKMIAEIKRVLKSDGLLIISTPEKAVYSDQANYSNPYHEKELYEEEFVQILSEQFPFIQLGYQKYIIGSLISTPANLDKGLKFLGGNFDRIHQNKGLNQEYLIAICSNYPIKQPITGTFFNGEELEKSETEELLSFRIKKFKSGFRYRFADLLFKPWDMLKGILK